MRRPRLHRAAALSAAVLLLAASCAYAQSAMEHASVQLVDGRILDASILSIGPKEVVLREGNREESLPRGELLEVTFAPAQDLLLAPGRAVLMAAGGDRLAVRNLRLSEGRLAFGNPMLGAMDLPAASVERIYLPREEQSASTIAEKVREMSLRAEVRDVLLVERSEGGLVSVEGVLTGIAEIEGEAKVVFQWQGRERTLSLAAVRAILLAGTGEPPDARLAGALTGRAGCRVRFQSFQLAGPRATVTSDILGTRTLLREAIADVRFQSGRVVALSEMTPVSVREYGFFDTVFPHRVNRSVGGGALVLDGRQYRTGLGLHSFCELAYRLDGEFDRFVATVGIDDAVRPRGDALLHVLGDGEPLADPLRLRGTESVQRLRLDVRGVRELTLRVEFGPDGLDVSDHVDIAGARLIRPEK